MKKELFNLLIESIEDKTSVMKEIIIFLNENLEDFEEKENDNEDTKYNKRKIREFISYYRVYNQNDIVKHIRECIQFDSWNLEDIKNFIEDLDTSATEFCYDLENGTFISIDNLYDFDYFACEQDLKIFIELLKDLK